ncbi:MAG: hypothetical protein V4580_18070 [Bacteroidota bacterium]
MILVKRNTAEFKEIKNLISEYIDLPARKKLILIYSLKSYSKPDSKILLNTIKKEGDVLYSLAYESLQEYMHAGSKKLFREEKTNLYYFKSNSTTQAIELPFELKGILKKKLSKLLVSPNTSRQTKIIRHPASKNR